MLECHRSRELFVLDRQWGVLAVRTLWIDRSWFGCLQAPTLGSRPLIELIRLGTGEAGLGVEEKIALGRHHVVPDHTPDFGEDLSALLRIVITPVGQIHVAPGIVNVFFEHPRQRSSVAVDRPDCLVGMAVSAGPGSDTHYRRRHRSACQERRRRCGVLHAAKGMYRRSDRGGAGKNQYD